VGLGALSVWMNWPESRGSLYAQVGLLFFVFLALSNGFGVQYLAWLVPWTAGAGALPAAAFHLTSGAFLFLVYRSWLGGGPWSLADSNRVGDWLGHLDYFQVLCWASVVALAWAAWRRMRSDVPASAVSFGLPARAAPIVAAGIAAALVGYPVVRQLRREPAGQERADVERQLLTIRTNDYVWLSYQAYSMGRFDAAIDAAHRAVILDPSSADGYNNLAAGYAALGMWDEAIESALAALQIRPDYTLARNNLAWAQQQKRLGRADGTSP